MIINRYRRPASIQNQTMKSSSEKFSGTEHKVNTTNRIDPSPMSILVSNELAREASS